MNNGKHAKLKIQNSAAAAVELWILNLANYQYLFNTKTQKALIYNSKTEQSGGTVIAEITKNLDSDQKRNVTMDVLKYIVYEQTEEIGEDNWIAAKEASDYMDEVIISVYMRSLYKFDQIYCLTLHYFLHFQPVL